MTVAKVFIWVHSNPQHFESCNFPFESQETAAMLLEKVRAHVSKFQQSSIVLSCRGLRLALDFQIPATDLNSLQADIHPYTSAESVQCLSPKLLCFVRELAERPLLASHRQWSDAGEFGDIVELLRHLWNSQLKCENQVLEAVGSLRGDKPSDFKEALQIFKDNWKIKQPTSVEVVARSDMNGGRVQVNPSFTVAGYCKEVARQVPADSSQVVISQNQLRLSSLSTVPATATSTGLQAEVDPSTSADRSLSWVFFDIDERAPKTSLVRRKHLKSTVEELAKRPLYRSPSGSDRQHQATWNDSPHFAELVRLIDGLLKSECTRGSTSSGEDADDAAKEVWEELERLKVTASSPEELVQTFKDEFGS